MNLSFFTKIFGRSVQLSQVLVKRSPTLGTLVSTKTRCIKLIFIGKITLVPVAFLMALSIYARNLLPRQRQLQTSQRIIVLAKITESPDYNESLK